MAAAAADLLRRICLHAEGGDGVDAEADEVAGELVDGLVVAAKALRDRDSVLLRVELAERDVEGLARRGVCTVWAHDYDAGGGAENGAELGVVDHRLHAAARVTVSGGHGFPPWGRWCAKMNGAYFRYLLCINTMQ